MVPWFMSQSWLRAFPDLSTRKKNAVKEEIFDKFNSQRISLQERISFAMGSATKAKRMFERGHDDRAAEAMREFTLDIIASQPVLNKYVGTSLELQMLEVMSLEGFEFPDALMKLRGDIDFGLFAINAMEDLDKMLMNEQDPFAELGIEIETD